MAAASRHCMDWSIRQRESSYTATGGRDVLFIISECFTLKTYSNFLHKAVPRQENVLGLTEEEACKLENQGIPRDCQGSDLEVMVARHKLDKRHRIVNVLEGVSCEQAKREISSLLSNTDKEGVAIHYIGRGKRDSGDWCFSDGFITFQDLTKLYKSNTHIHGRVLSIITDCSYSGHWVTQCMEFMDREGIGPCGHYARENGFLIKVLASCQPSEVPKKLAFSVHSASSEKNHGLLSFSTHYNGSCISDKQHPRGMDFTAVTCGRGTHDSCSLTDGYSWKKWLEGQRVQLVSTIERGQLMWYYVLLNSDEDKQREFKRKMASGKCRVKFSEYGHVLMRGAGEGPSNEAKDSIEREYLPVYR